MIFKDLQEPCHPSHSKPLTDVRAGPIPSGGWGCEWHIEVRFEMKGIATRQDWLIAKLELILPLIF
jgi:hypothetical protein